MKHNQNLLYGILLVWTAFIKFIDATLKYLLLYPGVMKVMRVVIQIILIFFNLFILLFVITYTYCNQKESQYQDPITHLGEGSFV